MLMWKMDGINTGSAAWAFRGVPTTIILYKKGELKLTRKARGQSWRRSGTNVLLKRITFNLNLVLHLPGTKNQLSIKDHSLLMVSI